MCLVYKLVTGKGFFSTPEDTRPARAQTVIQRSVNHRCKFNTALEGPPGPPYRVTGGFVIELGGGCYQDTYPMYLTRCILHVFRMYLDLTRSYTSRYIKIHQDTSRYIKIHQDTSRYIKIHLYLLLWPSSEMYLT